MSYRSLALGLLAVPTVVLAQADVRNTAPFKPIGQQTVTAPAADAKLQLLPIDMTLVVDGQGTLTVLDKTCVSKPEKDFTVCNVKVPGMTRYKATAQPASGLTIASWGGKNCADAGLANECSFKPKDGTTVSVKILKGVPVTVSIPVGPAYVDQKTADSDIQWPKLLQCHRDSDGQLRGTCTIIAPTGSKVTLASLNDSATALTGFASNQSGCSGMTCSFTASGPANITANFQQQAAFTLDAHYPLAQPVTISSDLGPQALQCIINTSKNQNVMGSQHCTAHVAKGKTITISAYFAPNAPGAGNIVSPVPTARFGGACAGSPPGKCSVTMTGDKSATID